MILQRTELKYIIPISVYPAFRKALMPFMEYDQNVSEGQRVYNVHSVYFDTPNYDFYWDKVEGVDIRTKFRIRFYDEREGGLDSDDPVWIEIKTKKGPFIKKFRHQTVERSYVKDLISGNGDPTLDAIRFEYGVRPLSPLLRVSYKREAMRGLYDPDVRITVDSEIQGIEQRQFHTRPIRRKVYLLNPFYYLLEIKIKDSIPAWLSHIIENLDLTQTVFSKYAMAVEKGGILTKQKGILEGY